MNAHFPHIRKIILTHMMDMLKCEEVMDDVEVAMYDTEEAVDHLTGDEIYMKFLCESVQFFCSSEDYCTMRDIANFMTQCKIQLDMSDIELLHALMYISELSYTEGVTALHVYDIISVAILVTCKILRDEIFRNSYFACIFSMDVQNLNKLELAFLRKLGFVLHFRAADMIEFVLSFQLETTCPILDDIIASLRFCDSHA
jgi:hypothetical protein